jgi:hypothetical protein
MDKGMVQWWAKTYDAVRDGVFNIRDSSLEELLQGKEAAPKGLEEMLGACIG